MSTGDRPQAEARGAAAPQSLVLEEVSGAKAISEAWLSVGDAFDPPFLERFEDPRGYLEKMARFGRTVVCFEKGEILGCATFYANNADARIAFLTLVAVSPSNRGRGIAKMLLNRVLELSAESGMAELDLEVAKGNAAALGLYTRMGFSVKSERTSTYILQKSTTSLLPVETASPTDSTSDGGKASKQRGSK